MSYLDDQSVKYYILERNKFGWKLRASRAICFVDIKRGDRVIDMCCGSGRISKMIGEIVGCKGKVLGVDYSKGFIEYANNKCRRKNVDFVCADAINILSYIGDIKYDKCVLLASWLWMNDKAKLFKAIRKSLKKDGTFLFSVSGDNLKDKNTKKFTDLYRSNLIEVYKKRNPKLDTSFFKGLPKIDELYVKQQINIAKKFGFKLKKVYEVTLALNYRDRLYTYKNPARTEWIKGLPEKERYLVIKEALKLTFSKLKVDAINRHTYYIALKAV